MKQSCPGKKLNYLIVDEKINARDFTSHIVTIISQNLDVISNLKHFRYETVCVIKICNFIPFHKNSSLPSERYFSRKLSEVTFIGRSYKPILVLPNSTGRHIKPYSSTSVNKILWTSVIENQRFLSGESESKEKDP